jgi:hypothetical protein
VALKRATEVVDLGLIINSTLNWDSNINKCITKANKRLGLVKRCTGYDCSTRVKLLCYTSLIRPLLEYNTIVWFCPTKRCLSKIESVQRRSSKFILCNNTIDYKNRLVQCKLLPLSLRRQFLDCIFLYNNIHELNNADIGYEFMSGNIDIRTRYQVGIDDLMLKKRHTRYDLYDRFYTNRITYIWNKIPYEIRSLELNELGNNSTLKRSLKKWFWDYFIEYFDTSNTCTWIVNCRCQDCRLT